MDRKIHGEICVNISLKAMGWDSFFGEQWEQFAGPELHPGRVVEELRGLYRIRTEAAEFLAEVEAKLRRSGGYPAVGDWVGVRERPAMRAQIEHILSRRTKLSRKVVGRELREQIVAANLDVVFVVTSLNRDFNLRRLERYLTLVWDGGARPVVLLNKADLCADPAIFEAELVSLAGMVPVHRLSALEEGGIDCVWQHIQPGETAALVGSSGVGKSTIINKLAGRSLATAPVREGDDRGRHTTTTRQMIFLEGGGMLIDTPGMRELQLWGNDEGVEKTFDDIAALGEQCRFRDCNHTGEPGCVVIAAAESGKLDIDRLDSYRKLRAELEFQRRKADPKLARDQKEQWKKVHKAMRNTDKRE
jgi:ribosome biogenesis GTPase